MEKTIICIGRISGRTADEQSAVFHRYELLQT